MPYALLLVKPGRGLEELGQKLALELPNIIAPALSLGERELHDGKVTPNEIMVWLVFGQETVNGKDLELLVAAHNFPERVANIEDRKEQILAGIRTFLADYDRNVTGAVCVFPTPMAYGEI
jgi:hypothetical protein